MPWNSDDGGGKGPLNQGPWGQGPKGPKNGGGRGPGNLPPDLDEIIRRAKDSFKNVLPQGGMGGSWLLPLALVGAFWLYNSIYQVQADERGIILRFGQYARTTEPGLHFALWPVETIEKPKVGAVRQINIGMENTEGQMLTSDKNIISVPFSVLWRISDPKDFLFDVADQERVIRSVAQSAMREVVGQTRAQMILTTGKDTVAAQVQQITQGLLDEYKSGVIVSAINLGDVQPPAEVANAFSEVVRAGQNKQQSINEAEQYRNQQVRLAEGEAAKLVEDANAYKSRVVFEAQGEAARFLSVYDQYAKAKGVTRERLYLETMEDVFTRTNKVILEGGRDGSGVVPYLPLPEIQKRAADEPVIKQN
jgi:modulator of FtsH protease HflK